MLRCPFPASSGCSSRRGSVRCLRRPARRYCGRPLWPGPTSDSSTVMRSPRPRRPGSCGSSRTAGVEFVHPLYSSAVYATASLSRRRDTHRVLAGLVSDPEERARHLALACDMPDEEVAQAVDGAARQARMRGAPDMAAELTELALRLSPSGPGELERRIALAEHLYVAGDFARGAELLEDARASFPTGELRTRRCSCSPSSCTASRERPEPPRSPSRPSRARTSRFCACVVTCALLAGRRHRTCRRQPPTSTPRSLCSTALPKPSPAFAAWFSSIGCQAGSLPRSRAGHGNGAVRARPAKADPPRDVDERLVFTLGLWLRYVDDLDGARTQFEEAQRTAREEGDDASLVNILFNRMTVELWAGEWAKAQGFARELGEGLPSNSP